MEGRRLLDLSLITKPEEKKKPPKRVTHSVKETGLVGGLNLEALTVLVEHGAMCRNQLSEHLDWTRQRSSNRLADLVRLELAEKTGETNEGCAVYAAIKKDEA